MLGSPETAIYEDRMESETGDFLGTSFSPVPPTSHSPSAASSASDSLTTSSDYSSGGPATDGSKHNNHESLLYNEFHTRDYATKHNHSKDEAVDEPVDMDGDGQTCSCSVSVRSSSPESVLSLSGSGGSGSGAGWRALTLSSDLQHHPIELSIDKAKCLSYTVNEGTTAVFKHQVKATLVPANAQLSMQDGSLRSGWPLSQDDKRQVTGNALKVQGQKLTSGLPAGASEREELLGNGHVYDAQRWSSNGETPIEREIRQAGEREDELRWEKERLAQRKAAVKVVETTLIHQEPLQKEYDNTAAIYRREHTNTKTSGPADRRSLDISMLTEKDHDIQRKLATIRLQQEIEEQKRREMDLRQDGRVKSISEEHADLNYDIPNVSSASTINETPDHKVESNSSQMQSIDPPNKPNIRQQCAFFEQTSTNTKLINVPVPSGKSVEMPVTFRSAQSRFNGTGVPDQNFKPLHVRTSSNASSASTVLGSSDGENRPDSVASSSATLGFTSPSPFRSNGRPRSMIITGNFSPSYDSGLASTPASPSVCDAEFNIGGGYDKNSRANSIVDGTETRARNYNANVLGPIQNFAQNSHLTGQNGTISNMKVPASIERLISSARGKISRDRMGEAGILDGQRFGGYQNRDEYVDFSAVRAKVPEDVVLSKVKFRSAEKKISDELREMEMREDELRRLRSNLGLPVPASKDDEENRSETSGLSGPFVENGNLSKASSQMSLVSVSPSYLKTSTLQPKRFVKQINSGAETEKEKPTRRRTSLVAQWEERIQQQA